MPSFNGAVQWEYETGTVMGSGDLADDPAIRVGSDPTKSMIVGTSKASSGGLVVWNLQGVEVSRTTVDNPSYNNVDIVQGFAYNGAKIDLVAASNRNTDAIDFFSMDAGGGLKKLGSVPTG